MPVDSGASEHYLDSDLIPNLRDVLLDYEDSSEPATIVGAGGHELQGVGQGTIRSFVRGAEDRRQLVNLKCTIVPGLERHLFSTGTSQNRGIGTILTERPRLLLPGLHGIQSSEVVLRRIGPCTWIWKWISAAEEPPLGRQRTTHLMSRMRWHLQQQNNRGREICVTGD